MVPLTILAILAIFFGYVARDLFVGIGTDFLSESFYMYPNHVAMVEAEFGLMHITGERDGPPVKVGVAVTDLTTGLYTANAVMASLIKRGKDPQNRGQWLDVALSDCQTATLANIASEIHG